MREIDIAARGMTFRALTWGPDDGRPVVLLHGFPETSACWRQVAPVLAAAGHRVLAVDQRGYSPGARPAGVSSYAIPELAFDVVSWLDTLGYDRADVVGHDWGAAVAWAVGGRHADRVRSLTAISVPHPGAFSAALARDKDQRERSSYMDLLRMEGKAEDLLLEGDCARLRAMYGAAVPPQDIDAHVSVLRDRDAMTAACNYYRAMNAAAFDGAGDVVAPTLYVWSDGDTAIGSTAAKGCEYYVKGPYRFEVLEGITHWIPEQAPDQLATLIVDHLAGT
jgi:pimeloyl-ACP methyl ester carboxylesterase